MKSKGRLMNHTKEDLPGRSFIHPFYLSGTTSSNLTTDATYFLHITLQNAFSSIADSDGCVWE